MEAIIFIILMIVVLYLIISRINKTLNKEDEPKDVNHHYEDDANPINQSADQASPQSQPNNMDSKENQNEESKPDTLGLMFRTLSNLGCQPETNDDGTISVQYQGENFHMEFGGMYARVWDPMWAEVKADDPDLPKIREAINAANFCFGPTVVFTTPNEDGVIGIHSVRDIMLHPACPDNEPFVKAVLDTFFDTKVHVRNNFKILDDKQQVTQKKHNPIGFTANQSSSE